MSHLVDLLSKQKQNAIAIFRSAGESPAAPDRNQKKKKSVISRRCSFVSRIETDESGPGPTLCGLRRNPSSDDPMDACLSLPMFDCIIYLQSDFSSSN